MAVQAYKHECVDAYIDKTLTEGEMMYHISKMPQMQSKKRLYRQRLGRRTTDLRTFEEHAAFVEEVLEEVAETLDWRPLLKANGQYLAAKRRPVRPQVEAQRSSGDSSESD